MFYRHGLSYRQPADEWSEYPYESGPMYFRTLSQRDEVAAQITRVNPASVITLLNR
jgi:hypothetical protein